MGRGTVRNRELGRLAEQRLEVPLLGGLTSKLNPQVISIDRETGIGDRHRGDLAAHGPGSGGDGFRVAREHVLPRSLVLSHDESSGATLLPKCRPHSSRPTGVGFCEHSHIAIGA